MKLENVLKRLKTLIQLHLSSEEKIMSCRLSCQINRDEDVVEVCCIWFSCSLHGLT